MIHSYQSVHELPSFESEPQNPDTIPLIFSFFLSGKLLQAISCIKTDEAEDGAEIKLL